MSFFPDDNICLCPVGWFTQMTVLNTCLKEADDLKFEKWCDRVFPDLLHQPSMPGKLGQAQISFMSRQMQHFRTYPITCHAKTA